MPTRDPERRRENARRNYARIMATRHGRDKLAAKNRRRRASWIGEAIEALIEDGHVTISGRRVTVQAGWTRWAPMSFEGVALTASLEQAMDFRAFYRRAHPND